MLCHQITNPGFLFGHSIGNGFVVDVGHNGHGRENQVDGMEDGLGKLL